MNDLVQPKIRIANPAREALLKSWATHTQPTLEARIADLEQLAAGQADLLGRLTRIVEKLANSHTTPAAPVDRKAEYFKLMEKAPGLSNRAAARIIGVHERMIRKYRKSSTAKTADMSAPEAE